MQNNTNVDLAYPDEDNSDKEETAIITNIDEFCTINELQPNPSNNPPNKISQQQHQQTQTKKLEEPYKISSPMQAMNTPQMNLYSFLLNNDNNTVKNKKISRKKLKMNKKFVKKKIYIIITT